MNNTLPTISDENTERIIKILDSNQLFIDNQKQESFIECIKGQHPWVTALYCCDSRVQAQAFSKTPINQVFTVESIGNAVKNSEASVDYGIYHLKTTILLIIGHSDCGAIKACRAGYENEKSNSIKEALNNISEAFKNGAGEELKDSVQKNIDYQVSIALEKYKDLVDSDKLLVIGAYYDFANDFNLGHGRLIITNINGVKKEVKTILEQLIPNYPIGNFTISEAA